jgi:hypothetical protein
MNKLKEGDHKQVNTHQQKYEKFGIVPIFIKQYQLIDSRLGRITW